MQSYEMQISEGICIIRDRTHVLQGPNPPLARASSSSNTLQNRMRKLRSYGNNLTLLSVPMPEADFELSLSCASSSDVHGILTTSEQYIRLSW